MWIVDETSKNPVTRINLTLHTAYFPKGDDIIIFLFGDQIASRDDLGQLHYETKKLRDEALAKIDKLVDVKSI